MVTGGNPRNGRLDNGLYATEYTAVADVDPRVGEHLLDVLGNRGIAAYLQPTADQHPVTRLTTLPARPTDRLFVDRSEVDTAREFLDILAKDGDVVEPEPVASAPATRTSTEFEDAWASIVAGYQETAERPEHDSAPWPAIEDVAPSAPPRDLPIWRSAESGSLLSGLDDFGASLPDDEDDDDETYHPPPPPPLPRFKLITILSTIAVIGGLIVVIDPGLVPIDPTQAVMLGCAALLAGAIGLIGRLRAGGPDDDDWDNGAVV
jgi:hypothetical protein